MSSIRRKLDLKHFSSTLQVQAFAFDAAIHMTQKSVMDKVERDGLVGDEEYRDLQRKIDDLLTVARSMGLPL
ncbi:hypothetical protein [Ruegeria faecimaris]|uniref:hypothetical protein n=1 Tax=Ruegeria faecimaris TaxID=686389 RepID=UPI002330B372|nr:hypothetical protein [Ruegeria faecimaris]